MEGNSQAIALTYTTSSGGKNPGASRALAVFQTGQASLKESLSPHADDLSSGAEAFGNLIVGETFVSQKHHLGADHHKIRQRIFVGAPNEFLALIPCKSDLVRTFTRHRQNTPQEEA
jgi:hypothetical protein